MPVIRGDLTAQYLESIRGGAKKEASTVVVSEEKEIDENQELEIAGVKAKVRELEARFKRGGHIHLARLIGLGLLFLLVVFWLVTILGFVFLSGFKVVDILELSDAVIIALISSTTVNVVGLFVIAARWLYGEETKAKE